MMGDFSTRLITIPVKETTHVEEVTAVTGDGSSCGQGEGSYDSYAVDNAGDVSLKMIFDAVQQMNISVQVLFI